MEASLVYDIVRSICILVGVPHLVIDVLSSVIGWGNRHNVCHSDIPVRLRHAIHCVDSSQLVRGVSQVVICQEVPMMSIVHGA